MHFFRRHRVEERCQYHQYRKFINSTKSRKRLIPDCSPRVTWTDWKNTYLARQRRYSVNVYSDRQTETTIFYAGEYPAWHLNRIAVYDLQNIDQQPSYFLINAWLSLDIHPFRCHLIATRSTDRELFSFRTMWKANAINYLSERSVWLSTFFK